MKRVLLRVDQEYGLSPEWWDAARAVSRSKWPKAVRDLIYTTHVVEAVVSQRDFAAFHRIACRLPGWRSGPRFAPCPLIIITQDDGAKARKA